MEDAKSHLDMPKDLIEQVLPFLRGMMSPLDVYTLEHAKSLGDEKHRLDLAYHMGRRSVLNDFLAAKARI